MASELVLTEKLFVVLDVYSVLFNVWGKRISDENLNCGCILIIHMPWLGGDISISDVSDIRC